jgi:rhodanese-related sulfurtransferase
MADAAASRAEPPGEPVLAGAGRHPNAHGASVRRHAADGFEEFEGPKARHVAAAVAAVSPGRGRQHTESTMSKRWTAVVVGVAMAVAAAGAWAADGPPIPKEVSVIHASQLKKMIDAKDKFVLVDTRNPREYKEGFIPGAISVYDKDMEANKSRFPADKGHALVFYCNGYPQCVRSLNGAKIALGWGYKTVHLYLEGMPDWVEKGYPVERK